MFAGGMAGGIAAGLTNSMEAVTVAQQTNPLVNLEDLIRKEGTALLTKGITARVYYNTAQSIVLFNLVKYIGKVFDD